jgi:hypothetical protein
VTTVAAANAVPFIVVINAKITTARYLLAGSRPADGIIFPLVRDPSCCMRRDVPAGVPVRSSRSE